MLDEEERLTLLELEERVALLEDERKDPLLVEPEERFTEELLEDRVAVEGR